MSKAVTGPTVVDDLGNKFNHRRPIQKLKDDGLEEGQDGDGYFKFETLDGYLPPWEAFLHPECGLYQDFFRVRWGPRQSNGAEKMENVTATWEPDECLPSCLDNLRIA